VTTHLVDSGQWGIAYGDGRVPDPVDVSDDVRDEWRGRFRHALSPETSLVKEEISDKDAIRQDVEWSLDDLEQLQRDIDLDLQQSRGDDLGSKKHQ